MRRRLGWLLTLVIVAMVAAILAAPQIVFAVGWLAGDWLPPALLQPLRHAAYEAGLWGAGLATWLVARRIGWLSERGYAVALVASPAVAETIVMLFLGRLSGGIATWTGALARLLVGAAAIAIALWSTTWDQKVNPAAR
jgi:hypothetical protein